MGSPAGGRAYTCVRRGIFNDQMVKFSKKFQEIIFFFHINTLH